MKTAKIGAMLIAVPFVVVCGLAVHEMGWLGAARALGGIACAFVCVGLACLGIDLVSDQGQ